MRTNLQTKGMLKMSSTKVEAPATGRCTEFLISWMKRFGKTLNLFVFPSNNKEVTQPLNQQSLHKGRIKKLQHIIFLLKTEIIAEGQVLKF